MCIWTEAEQGKNRIESWRISNRRRWILVLFFSIFIMTGFYDVDTVIENSVAQEYSCGLAHVASWLDAIQTPEVHVLCAVRHSSDNFISVQRLRTSVFGAFRKLNSAPWNVKFYIESFLAVLFKIAVIPCVIFLLCHFARNVNRFLWRINCGFIHAQDGKKRISLSA